MGARDYGSLQRLSRAAACAAAQERACIEHHGAARSGNSRILDIVKPRVIAITTRGVDSGRPVKRAVRHTYGTRRSAGEDAGPGQIEENQIMKRTMVISAALIALLAALPQAALARHHGYNGGHHWGHGGGRGWGHGGEHS